MGTSVGWFVFVCLTPGINDRGAGLDAKEEEGPRKYRHFQTGNLAISAHVLDPAVSTEIIGRR